MSMSNASKIADSEGRKIFLGGLSYECQESDLKSDFGKYGELEDMASVDAFVSRVRERYQSRLRVVVNCARAPVSSEARTAA